MSQKELDELRAAELELQRKMEELQEKKRALEKIEAERIATREREELLKKPITVLVQRVSSGTLVTKSDYRPDLSEFFRTIPGRAFRGYAGGNSKGTGFNSFPIKQWEEVERKLSEFPFVTVEYENGVKEKLDWLLNAPPYEISWDEKREDLVATPGPNQYSGSLYTIPGVETDYSGGASKYYIPRTEAWRIPDALDGIDGVVYTPEARAIVVGQIAQRSKLDQIALKDDSDFMTNVGVYTLKPYQRVGVEFIDATGGQLILGDDTGLGKTIQSLAWAEKQRAENPEFQTLCIVKPSSIANWRREIKNCTGAEPFQCFTGRPNAYDAKRILVDKEPYVLISYNTMGSYRVLRDGEEVPKKERRDSDEIQWPWVELFNMANFDLRILDEAHQVKNPSAYRTKAVFELESTPHTIPMTATPILNRVEELGNLIRLVSPHQFRSHEDFKRRYTIDGRQARNAKELKRMMRTFSIRRRKAEVIKDFSQINRIQRFHDLSPKAQNAYDEVLSGFYTELKEFDPYKVGGDQMRVTHYFATVTRLKQICAADKIETTADLAMEISDQENGDAGKKKVLIFSHFKAVAYEIARRLGSEAVCTVYHNGHDHVTMQPNERDELFERIRDDDSIKFVVTTEASKENHNLEYCWWTIFNDPWWTPLGHYQAEGRCIRISAPHSIDSYYVIASTQVEETIYKLLEAKLALHDEIVDGAERERDFTGSIGMELLKELKASIWSKDS